MNKMKLYMTIKTDVPPFRAICFFTIACCCCCFFLGGVVKFIKITCITDKGHPSIVWETLDPPLLLATGSLKFALTQADTFTNVKFKWKCNLCTLTSFLRLPFSGPLPPLNTYMTIHTYTAARGIPMGLDS